MLLKTNNTIPIKTLKDSLVNILPLPLNIINELDKTVIFLIKTIDKAINISTSKAKLCFELVSRFDKKCKYA